MNTAKPATVRQNVLAEFLDRVWSGGDVERCDAYLAEAYAIRHNPGDPWDGRILDLAGFKERVRISRRRFRINASTSSNGSKTRPASP